MTQSIRVVMAQINFQLGDIEANTQRVISLCEEAVGKHTDLIIFPELTLSGYPPEDLLLREDFHQRIKSALTKICVQKLPLHIIVGYPEHTKSGLYNSAAVIYQGNIIANYRKQALPNYSVFDEKRYFVKGTQACVFQLNNLPIGLTICEDLWLPESIAQTARAGAKLVISINASPYEQYKSQQRQAVLRERVQEQGLPIIYVHWVAGQDELVFDGGSLALDSNGKVCQHAGYFEEKLQSFDISFDASRKVSIPMQSQPIPSKSREENVYDALVLGVRDYVNKNGFDGALIGLSGGIDSALTLAITVDALGKERVEAVFMPSRYSSQMSAEDAETLAKNLGVRYTVIPIEPTFQAFIDTLAPRFAGLSEDTTEENLQARCRGTLLMALSNKTHRLVLTTGNKSEIAVGYSTLYGDMAGGFCVLKDVLKTMVYRLSNYRNELEAARSIIPQRIIDRPASAELAHNQTDQDSLPDYEILDEILVRYAEQDQSIATIVAATSIDETTVRDVVKMIALNEHKRRQAPPGVRVSPRAFGRDRRYPITSRFGRKE